MRRRWAGLVSLLLLFAVFTSQEVMAPFVCDYDSHCDGIDEAQSVPECSDCFGCNDGFCYAAGSETCANCPQDCLLCNGASCNSDHQCQSGACCGAPSGVCVATISCSPGSTEPCSDNPPKIRTCNNLCSWGSCTQSVQCVEDDDCDDGSANIRQGLIETCNGY